jgi:hypothetical protein
MLVLVLVSATVLQAHEGSSRVEDPAMRETIKHPLIGQGMERPRTPVLIAV